MPDENPAGKPLGDESPERPEDKPADTNTKDTSTKDTTAKDTTAKEPDGKAPEPPEPKDDLVTTHHQLRVGRRRLAYTATTGRVVLREEELQGRRLPGLEGRAPRCR